jgi:hypothetical protein
MAKADTTPSTPPLDPPADPPVEDVVDEEPVEEVELTRAEKLAADLPVQRSGLAGPSHDDLNPGFRLDTH